MAVILDTEIYPNYFLLSLKHMPSGKIAHFEIHDDNQAFDVKMVQKIMSTHTTVSFNGLNFDLPLIVCALRKNPVSYIKVVADEIIKSKGGSWKICKDFFITIPNNWDHIDLIDVAPGRASLKIYGGRLHAPKMQDLPLDPSEKLTPEQCKIIKHYCENDLNTTELLYNKLLPQIRLRKKMSAQYAIDLRSKSDPQIAENVIKKELKKITGKVYKRPNTDNVSKFKYRNPQIVSFENDQLKSIFQKTLDHDFEVSGNGSIKMPDWLKETKIKISQSQYQMGIGGIHSCEKSQLVRRENDNILCDWDVASYYPSIIMQQQLAPESMGIEFLHLYQKILTERLEAKVSGNKVITDTFKIVLNGSFGKLGNKYSPLYAPELFLQVTITGQLCLLMLIERMEKAGISIMSANTDGIVCKCSKSQERLMELVAWNWMLDTSFKLERTDYSLLASRDVNSYFAIKPDGKVKRKGIFAMDSLMKNPNRNIVYTAVIEFLKSGTPIEDTIKSCDDIRQFITVRHVQGGAVYNKELLGKAVRFYSNKNLTFDKTDDCIKYAKNGNKVPNSTGCKPIMDLPESLPDDIDYNAYIVEAKKLLQGVGYK